MRSPTVFLAAALAATALATKGTLTHLTTTYITTTKTLTSRTPAYVYTATTTSTFSADSYTFVYTSTRTAAPSTTTRTKTLPASKTVTVPTAKQLTPVPKESFYTDALVTSTSTIVQTFFTTTYLRPTTTVTTRSTSTFYLEITHSSFGVSIKTPTVTTTRTTAPATQTTYAACATSNIVSRTPEGALVTNFGIFDGTGMDVPADNAVECCSKCAARHDCFGGVFAIAPNPEPGCHLGLIIPQGKPCNGSIAHGSFIDPDEPAKIPQAFIFNGKCGQFVPSYP